MPKIQNILIVAKSAGMLVRYAANAGYTPLVIDCYSDVDTENLSIECVCISSLSLEDVEAAFNFLANKYTISHLVYGSGLERYINTLEFLGQKLNILGNTLHVYRSVQNKFCFFLKLNCLKIPYPDTCFQAPNTRDTWLVKPLQGEGGIAIKKFNGQIEKPDSCYWQKYIPGMSMSVLFIATETEYDIIGFNKQLSTQIKDNGFVFSGVITQPEINENIIRTVTTWLDKLVFEIGLKGINSLDFIVKDEDCYTLEVNARPSASMQLYDDELLSEHIKCFYADKLKPPSISNTYRAYKIIYAEEKIVIKKVKWPIWVTDIPETASIIHIGMPICSIIADGKNEQHVFNNIQLKQQQLSKLLR
jgi:methenyltetrahydromethanopterin cyclohydrolase